MVGKNNAPKANKPSNGKAKKPGTINIPSFKEVTDILQKKFGNPHPAGREINLVPDIKEQMIKALKLRNLTFFICIVVASAFVALTLVFASIAGGQQAIVNGNKTTLANLSDKVNSYGDLSDFLTIKDQLGNLSSLSNNKKLLSRTFTILSALIPNGANTIKISELSINLSGESPVISFDAQADAGEPPYIDYNVLDSFKKSMKYMRYDYGNYVDKEGATIPAYCIIENGADGATLYESGKGYYAYWLITGEGCNPSYNPEEDEEEEEDKKENSSTNTKEESANSQEEGTNNQEESTNPETDNSSDQSESESKATKGYVVEEYDGKKVVKIWRTPQYKEWYKEEQQENMPYMSLDGEISNVAHFNSLCITYTGTEDEKTKEVTWKTDNESCLLVPDGDNGIRISDSSNGRGASGSLVLRFSASITLNPEVYSFKNNHVLAIAPTDRRNVTDSYVQIQNMFSERAADCEPGDTACSNNDNNGGNNG